MYREQRADKFSFPKFRWEQSSSDSVGYSHDEVAEACVTRSETDNHTSTPQLDPSYIRKYLKFKIKIQNSKYLIFKIEIL